MSQLSGGTQNEVTPYFVYGTLKPSEIAHYQIKDLIDAIKPARLTNYALYLRDGIPVIFKTQNWNVDGFLFWPKEGQQNQFKETLDSYEGERLYSLQKTHIMIDHEQIECLTYVGNHLLGSHVEPLHEPWSSKDDPIFSMSFPQLFEDIKECIDKDISTGPEIKYWSFYNDLTSKYLLLITIVERLAYLYCGESFTLKDSNGDKVIFNDRIMKRITTVGKLDEFLDAYNEVNNLGNLYHVKIYDSRDARKSLDTRKPKEALEAWYQVRSNLQHRGKSAREDVKTVRNSLVSLANIIKVLLPKLIPTLEKSDTHREIKFTKLISLS